MLFLTPHHTIHAIATFYYFLFYFDRSIDRGWKQEKGENILAGSAQTQQILFNQISTQQQI
jgi:hypothetical protein